MRSFDRRGLELAVSTIIVLIVSVVILSLALTVTYRAFCEAEELSRDVDSQQQQRIEQILSSSGGTVVVGDNTKTAGSTTPGLCIGGSGHTAQFAVGVRGSLEPGSGSVYTVVISRDSAPPGAPSSLQENEVQFFGAQDPVGNEVEGSWRIDRGQRSVETVLISLPPGFPVGQYVYTVTIKRGNQPYGAQQLYVIAE